MPIHDWTRVGASVYHDFHGSWITYLKTALNQGVLPPGYSAISERRIGLTQPDIIAMSERVDESSTDSAAVALAIAPRVRIASESEPVRQLHPRMRIAVRRDSDERIVAIIEIASPGNKSGEVKVRSLAEKVAAYLEAGVNVLLIDLFPPARHDLYGLHGAVWEYFGRERRRIAREEPLALVSYHCLDTGPEALLEPTAVGRRLLAMPLFLTHTLAVETPLEPTYMQAYSGISERYRRMIEDAPAASGSA